MRKSFMIPVLLAAFGVAFILGQAHTAQAAPATQSGDVVLTNADLDAVLLGGEIVDHGPGHRGPGRRAPDACMVAAKAIHDACPCEGLDGDGDGTPEPWGSHGAFMECVSAAAEQLAAGENPPPAECLTKIVERLDTVSQGDLKIGDEGFVCKAGDCPGKGPGHRGPGRGPRPTETPAP